MNGAVIHPGDKVTISFTLDEANDFPKKKVNTIHPNKTPEQVNAKELETQKKDQRPILTSRRTSSLLNMNIEGLLVVPEYEKRLRRNSYGGRESVSDASKETGVDPSDGMLTTSLCTTEL